MDTWESATGRASCFERAFANHAHLTDNRLPGSLDDFKNFEKKQYEILFTQMKDLLINLFRYENMPDTVNQTQLEIQLRTFGSGVCVGPDAENGDIVILGRASEYGFNMLGDAIPGVFDGAWNINKRILTPRNKEGDYVIFTNKASLTDFYSNDFEILSHYCWQLASIRTTQRMTTLQSRTPYLLASSKDNISAKLLLDKILNGDLCIEYDQDVDIDPNIRVMGLGASTGNLQVLEQHYKNVFNEMLTYFGVYSMIDKRERMLTDEIATDQNLTDSMGDIYFTARQQACELLNRRYGLNIQCRFNTKAANSARHLADVNQAVQEGEAYLQQVQIRQQELALAELELESQYKLELMKFKMAQLQQGIVTDQIQIAGVQPLAPEGMEAPSVGEG